MRKEIFGFNDRKGVTVVIVAFVNDFHSFLCIQPILLLDWNEMMIEIVLFSWLGETTYMEHSHNCFFSIIIEMIHLIV